MSNLDGYHETPFERWTRLCGLYLLAPLLALLSLPVAVQIAQKPDLGFGVNQLRVVNVMPGSHAAAAGLQPRDIITGVDGRTVTLQAEYFAALAAHRELTPITFEFERAGRPLRLAIQPRPQPQSAMIRGYSLWTVGITFLLIGWWVFSRRRDPVARNFFALCMIFAFFLVDVPELDNFNYMYLKEHVRTLLQLLLPAYVLRFFLQFPSLRRKPGGEPARLRLLLIPGWILFGVSVAFEQSGFAGPGSRIEAILSVVALIYMLGYFVAGLVNFGRRALRPNRPIQRTKMTVVLLGLVAGLLPFLAATLAGGAGASSPHLQYLALSVLLVPASFGLAILRYGALDKAFVVRISLIYGLLTLLVLLGYFVIVVWLGQFLFAAFGLSSSQVLFAIMAASALAILPLRRRVQRVIDHAFYPSRRANRDTMTQLAEEMTGLIEADRVIATLQSALVALFRPQHFALFLAPSGGPKAFVSRAATGTAPTDLELPADSGLAVALNRLRRPVFSEEIEDILLAGEADPASLTLLTRLETTLLVPLITGDRLLGFMSFGPKSGHDLYSQEDLANLHGLAVQAASVVESRRLYAESLQRKKLEMELEVARKIQVKLLPTEPLVTPHFTVCGRNESCRMVGGDYFDYFLREDGSLGLAIADVSGKGIPAALMMTSLRVAFRQEALGSASPREVIQRLNPMVASLVGDDSFICFFFAICQPDSGIMRYCNAGMDPPVLFRPREDFRRSLKKGGPVLGVDSDFAYREGALSLEPGDRLFLYTDGLTDARSPEGEFFDAGPLLDLVASTPDAEPAALLRRIFARINAFGGDEKSDDKTAIILEIKKLK